MSYSQSTHHGNGNGHSSGAKPMVNVAPLERALSAVAGTAIGWYALTNDRQKNQPTRNVLLAASTYLLYRGASGNCPMYSALRTGTAQNPDSENAVIPHGQGIKIDKVVTIQAPVEKIYDFWRNFENLPRFMKHLESVQVTDNVHSMWTAKAPLGMKVSWNAEVIADVPNERIAWKSIEPADVPNAGTVLFREAPGGRGTTVEVTLEYNPPAGKLGAIIAKLLGEEPGTQVEDDLRRFKQIMETGELAHNGHAPEDVSQMKEATV